MTTQVENVSIWQARVACVAKMLTEGLSFANHKASGEISTVYEHPNLLLRSKSSCILETYLFNSILVNFPMKQHFQTCPSTKISYTSVAMHEIVWGGCKMINLL